MKNILIAGENSYLGMNIEKYIDSFDGYNIDTLDVIDDKWKKKSFEDYDVIINVAGIAHVKETEDNKKLYYKVNRDLAFELAKKSKKDGVKQFIFLSSMSVYGIVEGKINLNTKPNPNSNYGKSKLEAENLIQELDDSNYKVVILRPPMIYGKGCKGNYPRLSKLALKTPTFPKVKNERSMLYIENLAIFIKYLIDESKSGLFFPQNKEYVNTSNLVKTIANVNNKKIFIVPYADKILKLFIKRNNTLKKVFGTLIYEQETFLNINNTKYEFYGFEESIRKTEIGNGEK